jgi:hypothetical protein
MLSTDVLQIHLRLSESASCSDTETIAVMTLLDFSLLVEARPDKDAGRSTNNSVGRCGEGSSASTTTMSDLEVNNGTHDLDA